MRLFQAWNEPNLARYLEPQWVAEGGRWIAFSPLLYRQMLNAFYAGVKAVAPSDIVATAGVAPDGEPDGVGRMAPLRFLRALLCLRSSSPAVGVPLVREPCPDPPHFDALAFHPLSVGDPDRAATSSLDVAIADASKVAGLLQRAERLGTVRPAGHKPVWVTELNWESSPEAAGGVPQRLQALWVSRALHRLWIAGVSLVAWQFLVDPFPALRAETPPVACSNTAALPVSTPPAPAGTRREPGRRRFSAASRCPSTRCAWIGAGCGCGRSSPGTQRSSSSARPWAGDGERSIVCMARPVGS